MPKKKKKRSEVEEHKWKIDSSLEECQKLRIPEPTVKYDIGTRVQYGAWDWSAILDVSEDGKIYKLFSVLWATKRNIPDHSEFKIHYEPWYYFVPYNYEISKEMEKLTQDDDIHFSYQQRDIMALLYYMFSEHGIDLDADYQRGNVWTPEQKVSLIDSIFKNIDIGKFTVIRRPWGDHPNKPKTQLLYEMLDGKQRITAITDFYLGKFKYKGLYFRELHPFDRNHFKHYQISYAETEPLTKEQKYRYFLKLNTTGTPVDPEHIKKVYEMWEKEKEK